jgi:hypothetical protein
LDTTIVISFREDSEVIDFFAPPREDFLLGGKPVYISED